MRRTPIFIATIAASLAPGPLTAQNAPPKAASAILDGLSVCRGLSDAVARLDCFDRAVNAIDRARSHGDLIVMDREDVASAKRSLFGFVLPPVDLFKTKGAADTAEIKELVSAVRAVRDRGHGMYSVTLVDGSAWSFTDEMIEAPRPGEAITIRRAALGSFKAQMKGHSSARIRRTG